MKTITKLKTSFSYLMHLTCSGCRKEYSSSEINSYCLDCQAPLLAYYDLDKIRKDLPREEYLGRPKGIWRWHELLPVQSSFNCVTLGEGDSALLQLSRLGKQIGLSNLLLKDESTSPTGSFEARGMAVAISKAKELGIRKVTIPTSGNAGGTIAGYAARAGLKAQIFMSKDTPAAYLDESRLAGAEIVLVDGLINESAGLAGEKAHAEGWFDLSTFKEPYRLEGKKTIGYELAEALGWILPDVIIYPVGGGAGLVSLWKAFAELEALGWLENAKRPRLVAVQAKGCAPIVKAFETGASFCDYWTNAHTIAPGLSIPKSFADHLILQDLYESYGIAISVSDESMLAAQHQLGEVEGVFPELEGAATLAALVKLVQQKWVQPDERVVLFNPGSGLKQLHYVPSVLS